MTTRTHLPCPCGKSSDAYTEYPNGGFCFSCKKDFKDDVKEAPSNMTYKNYTKQVLSYRGHSVSALKKYGVYLLCDTEPEYAVYTYPNGSQKKRNLLSKGFSWDKSTPANKPGLYGVDKFGAGSSKYITITEGEEDTHAAFGMLGEKYPVVSVQSSSTAVRDCTADKEYLDSFERIYLAFDNDKEGTRAAMEVSAMFPFQKIYFIKMTKHKDPNGYLMSGDAEEFTRIWWAAKRHDPENIVSSLSDMKEIFASKKKESICSMPFGQLESMTLGIRTGETYLFKAQEGVGKTEVLGAIEHHVLKNSNVPIGVIHLEEDANRTARRMVTYETKKPVHVFQLCPFSDEEVFTTFQNLVKTDGRMNFYVPGKNDDDPQAFLNAIRFMVASAGCKVVFFDHISRLATAFQTEDTVKMLDYLSTKLSSMAAELDFALIMISHVNDDGQTRGSRMIGKEAWTVVSLDRDIKNPDPLVRNRTDMTIEKNRYASYSGPAGSVYFNQETFCLQEEPPQPKENLPT